jgi:signal transduction histidine kinase/CHASE1-domain containing sensor protein
MKHLLTIERLNRFAWKHSYLMFTMSHDQQQQQQQEEAVQKDSSTMQTIASKNENTIDEASSDQPSSSPPPQQQPEDEDSFESPSNFSLYADIALIVLIGGFAAAAFLFVGIRSENKNSQAQFEAAATDLVNKIQTAWESYVTAASMMHNFCRNRNFARADFRGLYEYMISTGLNFQAVQFDPNITDAEREAAEAEARAYYAEYYPHVKYRGFTGFNSENSMDLESRHRSAFYFPIHYMEPVIGNERAIDLDYHAPGSPQRQQTVLACMQTGKPSLTDRLKLVQEKTESAFGVILMHPGVNVTSSDQTWPRDLASIVVRIPDLLLLATTKQHKSCQIYIYDRSDSRGYPLFLGAAHVHPAVVPGQDRDSELSYLSELSIDVAMTGSHYIQDIDAANKIWTVIVRKIPGTFEHNHAFVIFGGVIIFVSSGCLAVWVYTDTVRAQKIQQERAKAKAEKAAYVVQSAQLAANRERELNDFIAHEVRNPVAAAMAACSFVKTALHKIPPFPNKDALEAVCADVVTIDNALLFVNDLLRDMLDMHRATNHQLVVKFTPTDILHDVFEPVEGMLYQREGRMDIHIDCPENLVVMSDRLRLKQVILNLGRNSAKFVDSGFLRMRAQLDDKGMVQLLVEDSGPGIPLNKRGQLFNKYQESLDMLSQGTVRI